MSFVKCDSSSPMKRVTKQHNARECTSHHHSISNVIVRTNVIIIFIIVTLIISIIIIIIVVVVVNAAVVVFVVVVVVAAAAAVVVVVGQSFETLVCFDLLVVSPRRSNRCILDVCGFFPSRATAVIAYSEKNVFC